MNNTAAVVVWFSEKDNCLMSKTFKSKEDALEYAKHFYGTYLFIIDGDNLNITERN